MSGFFDISQRERPEPRTIPVPIAIAGVGLLISSALPLGLSGGSGFLIGLLVGFGYIGLKIFSKIIYKLRRSGQARVVLLSDGEKVAAPGRRAASERAKITVEDN